MDYAVIACFLGQVVKAIMLESSLHLLHGLCGDRLLPGAG